MHKKIIMKKIFFAGLFSLTLLNTVHAQEKKSSNSYIISNTDNNNRHTISIKDDNGSLDITYTGDISFTEEETAIKSLSQGAVLTYKKDNASLRVTEENGQLWYEVNGGAKKLSLDSRESALLADAVKTMIDNGVGAKERVERLYKKSGSKGVLDAVAKLRGDYLKSLYLDFLLATGKLSAAELTEVVMDVKKEISSDYEKGKLLGRFSEKYLEQPATAAAYLDAVKSIKGDYEKAKALKLILQRPLDAARFGDVMTVVAGLSSDYEKAGVLKKVLVSSTIPEAEYPALLKVAAGLKGDYEKSNVLAAILKNQAIPAAVFNETLAVIGSIGGNYEKASVLKQAAAGQLATEAQWISLINAAAKLTSDYDKASVLLRIAEHMQRTDNVKNAYTLSAKTISSDYDYGRTMRAIK